MRDGFPAIIQRLRSEDKNVVCEALKELRALVGPFEADEALALLEAAAGMRDLKCVGISVGAALVKLVEGLASQEPQRLAAVYADLDGDAQPAALAALAKSGSQVAIEIYCSLVARFGWPLRSYPAVTLPLRRWPKFPSTVFPSLLAASIPGDLTESYLIALAYAEAGLLSRIATEALIRDAVTLLSFCELRQQAVGIAWKWEDDYRQARERLEVALDLLGHTEAEAARPSLLRGSRLRDARLSRFAVISMLRLALTPDPKAIESIAADREMRSSFLRALEKLEMAWLIPTPTADRS